MNDMNLTDEELARAVDNDAKATERERELARRLEAAHNKLDEWKKWYGGGIPRGSV